MTKKVYSLFRKILLTVGILAIVISSPCCKANGIVVYSSDENLIINNYKTYTSPTEEDFHFAFEYPSQWSLSLEHGPIGFFDLTIADVTLEEFQQGERSSNYIQVDSSKESNAAETALKENISETKWSLQRNFRLREKHKVVVGGIGGWETVMTFRERLPLVSGGEGNPLPPNYVVERDIFFYHEGFLYHVQIYEDEVTYKRTKDGFDHMLKTFKIME